MENQLISVIVPVYNVEEYLKQCLDSILEQTFSNYEVILVNDGSTDSSDLICQEYAEKDARIRYYEKTYTSEELIDDLSFLERNDLSFSTIWGSLYKKSVFSFLRFPKGVIGEDVALIYKMYTQVDKIVYVHKDTYIYRENDSGISKSKIYPLVTAQLNHVAERLALLAIMGYDVTKHFDRYRTFLEITEYNMRMVWGMEDTETYRHIKENLQLISSNKS